MRLPYWCSSRHKLYWKRGDQADGHWDSGLKGFSIGENRQLCRCRWVLKRDWSFGSHYKSAVKGSNRALQYRNKHKDSCNRSGRMVAALRCKLIIIKKIRSAETFFLSVAMRHWRCGRKPILPLLSSLAFRIQELESTTTNYLRCIEIPQATFRSAWGTWTKLSRVSLKSGFIFLRCLFSLNR